MKAILLGSLAAVILAGCAIVKPTADSVVEHSLVAQDQYTKQTIISAPNVPLEGIVQSCQLIAIASKDRPSDLVFQLHVRRAGSDWMFPQVAHSSDGDRFEVERLKGDVSSSQFGVSVHESYAVFLPRAYVEKAARDGLDIRIDGQGGSRVIQLRNWYVEGFWRKVTGHLEASRGK
jgi:hypothetical protein